MVVWYNPATWFSKPEETVSPPAMPAAVTAGRRRKTRRGRKGTKRSRTGRNPIRR